MPKIDSKSNFTKVDLKLFTDCNRLLYKYNLPNIYHVIDNIESLDGWKVLIKKQIDSHVEKEWASDANVSLQWLNMQSMRVGQVHQVWKFIPHDVRTIKRAYPNSDYLQEHTFCRKTGPDSVGARSGSVVCFVGRGLRLVHTLLQGALGLRL